MNLNIGAGLDIREGYINCDIRLFPRIDMICDARKLPLKNESCKEILAIDILEHLDRGEIENTLKEWIRVLEYGGYLILQSPDILELFRLYQNGQLDFSELIRRLYDGQDYKENYHKAGFELCQMKELLERLGLEICEDKHINGNFWLKTKLNDI